MKTHPPSLNAQVFKRLRDVQHYHVDNGVTLTVGHWTQEDLCKLLEGTKAVIIARRGNVITVKFVDVVETRFWFDAYGA